MSPDIIELINSVGLPMAALLIGTTAVVARRIVTRGELDKVRAQHDLLAAELRAIEEELRCSHVMLARAPELGTTAQET